MTRGYHPARGHWASTRNLPAGFTAEQTWRLWREPAAGLIPLFECRAGQHNLISHDPGCEGLPPLGPVGHARIAGIGAGPPIYRCYVPGNGDRFLSRHADCEGQTTEELLGYSA